MTTRTSLFRSGIAIVAALFALGALTACDPPVGDGSDLGVVLVSPPATSAVGQTVRVNAGVTNHGTVPAVGAKVGYLIPDSFSVAGVSGSRVGACAGPTPVPGTSFLRGSCDLGTLAVGVSTSVEIDLVAGEATTGDDIHVLVASPGEPGNTGAPNVATFAHRVFDGYGSVLFSDPGPVAVGSTFVVSGSAPDYAVLEWINISVPSHLRVDAITVNGLAGNGQLPAECLGTGYIQCKLLGAVPIQAITFQVTALTVGGPAPLTISSSSEAGGAYGSVSVQVVDPTTTSDVYVEYQPVASAVVGEPEELRATIRSGGPTSHADVAVAVAVPAGITVQSATWGVPAFPCTITGSNVLCDIGPLAGYRTEPLVVVVLPTATTASATITTTISSSTTQDVPDPNPDVVDLTFPVTGSYIDLSLDDIDLSRDPFVETLSGSVDLTVRNDGTSTATGVTLVATFPESLRVATGAMPQPPPAATRYCSKSGQTFTCDIGTLAAGAEQPVRLWSWADDLLGGDVEISVSADQPDVAPDPHPNAATVPVTVVPPQADFAVTYPNTPSGPFIIGQPRNITIEATNLSGVTATPEVTFTAPAGFTVTPVSDCSVAGQVVTCVGWPVQENRSIEFRLTLTPTLLAPDVQLVATVSSELPDPDPASNEVVTTVDVVAEEVDLGLSVEPAVLPGAPGSVTHRYEITNGGPARADDVTFTATFPASVTVVSSNYGCTFSGSTATCDRNDLGAGDAATVTLTVQYADVTETLTHHVEVTSAQPERPDQTEPNELDVVVPAGGLISGVVTRPGGSPAVGVLVRIFSETDTVFPTVAAYTAADGSYSARNLVPGVYRVAFFPGTGTGLRNEWHLNKTTRATATPLPITAGEAYVVDAELADLVAAGGRINGVVTLRGGAPAPGVQVRIFSLTDTVTPTQTMTTAADGSYASTNLAPGEYRVEFVPVGTSHRAEWHLDQATRATATPLTITAAGEVHVADAELVPVGGSIRGVITQAGGAPVPGVLVRVFSATDTVFPTAIAYSLEDGTYLVPLLPPGEYRVVFMPDVVLGLRNEWHSDKSVRATADPLTITAASEDYVIDAELAPL